MNLYLLTQNVNNDYDTYDSCVVAALNEEDAKTIHPSNKPFEVPKNNYYDWVDSMDDIKCDLIGVGFSNTERGVILASFNAG